MLSLVTGSTGFLGSRLARLLVGQGARVRALVRRTSDLRRLDGLDVEIAEGDVTDEATLEHACAGVDRIFHCAAVYEIGARDPLVHVDDCAAALGLLAERSKGGDELIVAERSVTFREWFTLAARAAGRAPPAVWLPDAMVRGLARASALAPPVVREGLAMSLGAPWAFRGDHARRDLGWVPRSLEQGLRETMQWYRPRR